jgi:hypothetical protein
VTPRLAPKFGGLGRLYPRRLACLSKPMFGPDLLALRDLEGVGGPDSARGETVSVDSVLDNQSPNAEQ